MKTVVIGDLHGRGHWQKIITDNWRADRFVFLGDYWDSFDIPFSDQVKNFRALMEFKMQDPNRVVLLLGNHDCHYLPPFITAGEYYTGHQGAKGYQIMHLMEPFKEMFQMAYLEDGYLMTHAGVTTTWMKATMMLMEDDGFDLMGIPVDEYINQVWKASPRYFFFSGTDGYGDNVTQSPIWVRPDSLMKNAYQYETLKQVVGHTSYHHIRVRKERYFFIDCLAHGEYLIIEDGEYTIGNL